MKESTKIKKIIKEYKNLFDITDMDICQSIKGRWYFFRWNQKFKYYDCYTEFETAEELIKLWI